MNFFGNSKVPVLLLMKDEIHAGLFFPIYVYVSDVCPVFSPIFYSKIF